MSDVIRNVIIRTRIEAQKSRIEASAANLGREYEKQAKAAKEQAKAVNETSSAVREHGKAVKENVGGAAVHFERLSRASRKSTQEILSHTAEGMEGVMRFARGVGLLMTGTEEDTAKLLRRLLMLQAGFDVLAGGAKLVKGLGLAFGAAGLATGGVTLALGAGILAWNAWKQAGETAIKAASDGLEALRKMERERAAASNRYASEEQRSRFLISDTRVGASATDAQRQRLIAKDVAASKRESDRLQAEEDRMRRTMVRPRGYNFGETTPEQKTLLDELGGYAGLKERRTSIATQQMAEIQRQVQQQERLRDLRRQEFESQKQIEDQVRARMIGTAIIAGPQTALNAALFAGQSASQQQNEGKKFENEFSSLLNRLLDTMEDVETRRREFENQVSQGASK